MTKIHHAVNYFQQIDLVTIDVYCLLANRMVDKENAEKIVADQKNELAQFEGHENELKEMGLEGLARANMKYEASVRAVAVYDLAINTTAGAILQIAKQALSMRYGPLSRCPKGRNTAGTCVRDLIWQGRNQAMHYEETKRSSTWVDLFSVLNHHYPGRFALDRPYQSKAREILDVLGWLHDYGQYQDDMRTLFAG